MTQSVIDAYASMVHTAFKDSVRVRIEGATRPFGCLVSGGLDSSLVAGMVRSMLPSHVPLFTYSIGLKGATDEYYAKQVATYIQSNHTHFTVSKEELIGAIPEAIRAIGSYDTTTVRASVANYLVCKKIREKNECIYLWNGDGADELMGGYLYCNAAPNLFEFDAECRRLLRNIHSFDVLRSDRSIAGNGLAPRTPYLDKEFVHSYLSIPAFVRWKTNQICGKYLIRRGAEPYDYIPSEVLWRRKEAMSDGVSSTEDSWHTILQAHAETIIQGTLEDQEEYKRSHYPPRTKEQIWYRRIFESEYGSESATHLIPYAWMPRFMEGATDASARTLTLYGPPHSNETQDS